MKYFIGLVLSFFISCSNNYQITEDEKLVDAITAITAKKLQTEKNLILIGTGGSMMDGVEKLAMSFHYYKEIELAEARNLIVKAITEYLSGINNNQALRPYLVNYPFEAKNLEIRIWILNPDGSDPKVGKLEFISARKGVLKYYVEQQDSIRGKIIHTETYEEALNRLNDPKKLYKI